MYYYEKLYFLKDNKKAVIKNLNYFLLFQIYSPTVLRQAHDTYTELPWYVWENAPLQIKSLTNESPKMNDQQLQVHLNKYHIQQAVSVLSAYQTCNTPLTLDKSVQQIQYKLTSKQGDKALSLLRDALSKKQFTDKMAQLALYSGHKFLAQDKYYIKWKFPKYFARFLTIKHRQIEDNSIHYTFPTIQLTKGCQNKCSHCDSRAEPHLSHMPWPIFKSIYRGLNKYYRHYQQNSCNHYFSNFFADSDMLDYMDSIMDVDSGDIGLWIACEHGNCQYLTRGIKTQRNKIALAKALLSGCAVAFSFVDTPKENMTYNLEQLQKTLDVVDAVPERVGNPEIIHLHLKSGPSVNPSVFRDFKIEDAVIYALGRANDFAYDEVDHYPDREFTAPTLIEPNGNITIQEIKNGEISKKIMGNLFKYQNGPKINPVRLFIRQKILSHFR